MNLLICLFLVLFVTACSKDDVKRYRENEKLKGDSEEVVRDLLDIEEDIIKDKTGFDLKKGNKDAIEKGD